MVGEDFIAIDYKQDQSIDKVLIGDEDEKSEYQKIYVFGLEEASKKGKLKEKRDSYSFSSTAPMRYYNIITYFPAEGKPFNEFIFINAVVIKRLIKAVDTGADGELDNIILGIYDAGRLQKEYENFIKKAMRNKRISYKDEMYLVIPIE